MLYAEEILNTLSEWMLGDNLPNPLYIFEGEDARIALGTSVFEYQLRTHTRPTTIAVIAYGTAQDLKTGTIQESTTICVISCDGREETVVLLGDGDKHIPSHPAEGRIPDLMRLALGIA